MTSGPIELVIFDCDGVLVDSEPIAVRVETQLIGALGWDLTEADVLERFVGRSDAYMLNEIEATLGHAVPDWQARYETELHAALRRELTTVAGIEIALDELTLPTCVASSGSHTKLQLTLGLTGLLERFVGRIFSAGDVARGKPAPDLFLHAAQRCDVEPARCVVVEDSRAGIAAARAAGMRSLGYTGGLTPASWLENHATIVFDDMVDLPRLIDTLR